MQHTVQSIIGQFPLMQEIMRQEEVLWINESRNPFAEEMKTLPLTRADMEDASARLQRFAPFLAEVFEQTRATNGIIESPIRELKAFGNALNAQFAFESMGKILLKCDNALPISGSIKARGGIYEVLKHAETLAINAGMLSLTDNYACLASERFRSFFSQYHIAVGSTGNLGLSIGIISAQLGFRVSVHMSADAKAWKQQLLRDRGVEVVVYKQDYSIAVEQGRAQSQLDPMSYFVDDENSQDLFLGYSVAAIRVEKQLAEMGVTVDEQHPLFVHLPCGVGGGPGGVAFGLKQIYGDAVHFFFAEPTHAPCMLIGAMTRTHDQFSVQDFGIDNKTIADGLAVGRASGFVGKTLENLVSGCYTLQDETMLKLLALMVDTEGIHLEPSALSGFGGMLMSDRPEYQDYLDAQQIDPRTITHLVWATGGSMVPEDIAQKDYHTGKQLLER